MSGPLDIARAAWGEDLPDWVETLAIQCGKTSQAQVARELGRSAAAVSQILNRKYSADLSAMEERVRGVFQHLVISCPALGNMPMHVCQDWRAKGRTFLLGNPQRSRMYRACLKCPRNKAAAPAATGGPDAPA